MWKKRGRGPGNVHSYKDRRTLEYLARIAVMHKISSSELFSCIVEAWNQEESKCKRLNIRCRRKAKDSAIYLFTVNRKVVAQFPISIAILQGNNRLESYMRIVSAKASSVRGSRVTNPKIEDLRGGMKQVNLKAKVVEIPEPKTVYTRSGIMASISNALIADETGTIRMSLWNQQINMVSRGDLIKVEDARVVRFRGELQLRIGRGGSLSVIE